MRILSLRALATAALFTTVLSGTLTAGNGQAQTPSPSPTPAAPPEELTEAIARLDAAAAKEDLRATLRLFDRSFTHADGLTYDTLGEALTAFWQRFDDLSYRTVIDRWSQEGEALVAETTTTIRGAQTNGAQPLTLNAVLQSRQRYVDGKIVEQSVLSERSEVTAGAQPPTVQVMLPEQVRIGQQFDFDLVVQEPLGDRLLLGAALEEPINEQGYLTTTPVTLELLSAGGLFKTGRAPALPDSRWISGIVVREDGIVMLTRRLRVVSE